MRFNILPRVLRRENGSPFNVGIVVESIDDAISFFTEPGLKLKGADYLGSATDECSMYYWGIR
jgi:hypothetical protein